MIEPRRATLFCLLIALCACGDESGQGSDDASVAVDAGSANATPASCGEFGRDAVCAACLTKKCCVQGASCDTAVECVSLVTCVRACDPDEDGGDCPAGCVDDHPSGRGAYNELVLCMAEQCTDACYFVTP